MILLGKWIQTPEARALGWTLFHFLWEGVLIAALLALVLVIVAMVSALTAMRFAIHGQEVAVPPLVGLVVAPAHHENGRRHQDQRAGEETEDAPELVGRVRIGERALQRLRRQQRVER